MILDKQSYHAGEQINGYVEIRTTKNFPSNTLNLVITGKERVEFNDEKTSKKVTKEKTLLNHVVTLNSSKDN